MRLSRRKACLACSSKKRRCDMLYPSCTRCVTNGTGCTYTENTSNPIVQQMKKGTGSVEKKKKNKAVLVTPGISYTEESTNGVATISDNPFLDLHSNSNPAFNSNDQTYLFKIINSTPPISPPLLLNSTLDFDIDLDTTDSTDNDTSITNITTPSTNSPPFIQGLPDINITTPPGEFTSNEIAKVKQFKYFNLNYRLMLDSPFSEEASDLYIRRIRQYPKLFAKHLKISFIHPSLYPSGYPPILLTALSVCGLSAVQDLNDGEMISDDSANESLITSTTNRSINQLVDSMILPLPVLSSLNLHDKIAYAQAVLLTQCIRLYSGDIKQATQAEKLVLPLTAVFDDLVGYIHDENGNPKHSTNFEEWILIHSISRTCFLGSFIQGFYYYLREQPEYNLVAPGMPMTLSKGKWKATSQSEWDRGNSRDSQQYDMTIADTYTIFAGTTSDNYKELCFEAILMLCFCLGVDKVQRQLGVTLSDLIKSTLY